MTDPSETANASQLEGPGSVLRRARKARGLELRDIAQELHLDEWMLQALEEDDFTALGAPVFAKGHMRKYGSMLGLNPDDLMIAYYRKRGRDDSPPPIAKVQGRPPDERERSWLSGPVFWLVAVVGVMLVLSALWVLLPREDGEADGPAPRSVPEATVPSAAPSSGQTPDIDFTTPSPGLAIQPGEPPAQQNEESPVATTAEDATGDGEAGSDSGVDPGGDIARDEPTVPADAVEPVAPVVAEVPAADPGIVQITLKFNDESWVEVSDADNERLLYTMVAAGRTRTVSGRPPVTVYLGRARAVEVQVDGVDFPIPPATIRRNTARFVVDGAR